MNYSRIIGTGSYLPKNRVSNDDLAQRIDTSDEWIMERTGIRYRHIASADDTSATMATAAAQRALEAASLSPKDIDIIIMGTTTPDRTFPSSACLVQEKLGISGIPAFDLTAACAGFNYGLSIADQYIKTGAIKTALVIGSEVMSRIIDWTDRSTCILFGDGAGAAILQADKQPGILQAHIHADGNYNELLYALNEMTAENAMIPSPKVQMRGNEVFKLAVNKMGQTLFETLNAAKVQKNELDWLVPHQANKRIIMALAKKLEMPMDKVILTVEDHGNTSAASVPMALDVAIRDGRIKRGQLILLESFGAGLTWGSALIKY